ncbi:MAG: LysR family transcriptional regulator [Steroidobacteraceae bacterium]
MDLAGDLEIFTLVAEAGSFSAAGRRLKLAPSSVARVIDRIEARLGIRLLLRTTRSLILTPEGATYLSSARRILADLKETEQSIADQGSPKGRLRLSISQLFGRMFVVPLLREFIQKYPDILLEVISTDTVVDVAAGQADVAIRLGPLPDSPLTARRLGETHKVIVASPGYLARRGTPTVPEDLHGHDCIAFNFKRAAPTWPFRKEGRSYSLPIKGRIETNNGDTEGQLAAEGIGIARVCAETVEAAIHAGRLVPLLQEFNPGDGEEIHAVFVGGAHTPARVRCLVDFLAERLRPAVAASARTTCQT